MKATLSTSSMVRALIENSGKSPRELAEELGLAKPSVLTMIAQGQVKLPLDMAAPLARACGGDPVILTRQALREQHPGAWRVLSRSFGEPLTPCERDVLEIYRCITPTAELPVDDAMERRLTAALENTAPEIPDDPLVEKVRHFRSQSR